MGLGVMRWWLSVVAVVLFVAACGTQGGSPSASASAPVTVEPSGSGLSITPRSAATPTPFVTPTPTPSPPVAPDVAPCRAESLAISGTRQGETGNVNVGVAITNTSSMPCSLPGLPSGVELLRSAGAPLAPTVEPALGDAGASVVLRPGVQGDGLLTFYWTSWCQPAPGALRVRLAFDGIPGSVTGPLEGQLLPRCDVPGSPSSIQVDGIGPSGN